jgi:1-deoxy-D-xylulose-5-phosphate synthase
MVPSNEDELADMLYTASLHPGPSAIRYPRGVGPGVALKAEPQQIPIGTAQIVRDGQAAGGPAPEIAIFGLGALLPLAVALADRLADDGISAAVINPRFVKPLDLRTLESFAKRVGVIVTFEDHVLAGGFGSAVLEALDALCLQVPVVRIGWPDSFVEHGKVDSLRARYGVSVEAAWEKLSAYLPGLKRRRLRAVAR